MIPSVSFFLPFVFYTKHFTTILPQLHVFLNFIQLVGLVGYGLYRSALIS